MVRCTFSPARAWRPTVGARLARTLGPTNDYSSGRPRTPEWPLRRGNEERDQCTDSFSSVAVTSELAFQEKTSLGKLRQLFYLSRTDPQMTDSDVRQILRASQRNNRRKDITGCLLYSGKRFAQILEGEPVALDEIVTKIAADKRHYQFLVAIDRQVAKRTFPNWSMGILYKLDLADRIEALLAESNTSAERAIDLFGEMNPDTVMGDLL